MYEANRAGLPMMRFLVAHLASEGSAIDRVSTVGRFLAGGAAGRGQCRRPHCETTSDIADRLGLGAETRHALPQSSNDGTERVVPPGCRATISNP